MHLYTSLGFSHLFTITFISYVNTGNNAVFSSEWEVRAQLISFPSHPKICLNGWMEVLTLKILKSKTCRGRSWWETSLLLPKHSHQMRVAQPHTFLDSFAQELKIRGRLHFCHCDDVFFLFFFFLCHVCYIYTTFLKFQLEKILCYI